MILFIQHIKSKQEQKSKERNENITSIWSKKKEALYGMQVKHLGEPVHNGSLLQMHRALLAKPPSVLHDPY